MLLTVLIARFLSGIASIVQIESTIHKNKNEAKEKGWDSYLDHKGYLHHIETDVPYRYQRDFISGDMYEVNPYSGAKIRNISEDYRNENANKAKQWAIRDGRRFYQYEKRNNHLGDINKPNGICGYRYKDLYSNNEYVKREFCIYTGTVNRYNNMVFYLNIKTKMFDFAENKYDYNQRTKRELNDALKELNAIQDKMLRTGKNEFGSKINIGLDLYHNANTLKELSEFDIYGE